MMDDYFNSLTWQGNSRAMLDAIVAGTPSLFRRTIGTAIQEWAVKQQLTVVDEATVFRAVDELAPAALADKIKPELEKLRTV